MQAKHSRGFSLIELMVVVTIIGILALFAIPGIRQAKERTEATTVGNDLRVFSDAVEFYSTATGSYPSSMSYTKMPEEIGSYLPTVWKNGTYNWLYFKGRDLAYIYVYNLNFSTEQGIRLDSIVDDGNIATGHVRVAFNGTGFIYLFDGL